MQAWKLVVVLGLTGGSLVAARGDNWPNWRGSGLAGVASGEGYVSEWLPPEESGQGGKNILWRVKLPGYGASTPTVWEQFIVVTCGIDGKDAVLCFDRDGTERWRRELGEERPGKHKKATGCNSSPVTDGIHVWVYFKSGELACLRLVDGGLVWKTNLQQCFGEDTLWWDLGTSPVLTDKAVVVAVMQTGPSYLAAFDRTSGKLLWKHDRTLPAPEEAAQSYSTPLVLAGSAERGEPAELLVVLGADHVTAHDAADGRELWRVGGLNPEGNKFFRSIASPVALDDLVIAPYARGGTITAIRRGGQGDVSDSHVVWVRKDLGADVPTPAAADGRVVVCTDKGSVFCLEGATGKTLWQEDLPKNRHTYSSSPVLVAGRVLVTREDGLSTVLELPEANDTSAKIIGSSSVEEMTVATPVCVDGRVFLRTHDSLWCIGTQEPASQPNILVILADDLGFSDLGSYGGEIKTPALDRLAAGGLRFTQGYNTARCWPTRAALLTGYYPQAVGRDALPGGKGGVAGSRPPWAVLAPRRLAAAGYRSYHSGKWHIDGDPRKEGFARSLDVLGAAQSNYFDPRGVTVDGGPIVAGDDFYTTTAIGDHAVSCLAEHARDHTGTPFFHYVAFTAPHFPLQATSELIAKYRDRYLAGWDAVRRARAEKLATQGIVTTPPAEIERDLGPPYRFPKSIEMLGPGEVELPLPWGDLTDEQREFQATKMAIHAAMVDAMDQQIGRIVAQLQADKALDNTLVVFLSDNGGSAEIMVRGEGHDPTAAAGSRKTFLCLGPGWSSCANTPFRRHKTWVHEGGIATPWIVHWPAGFKAAGELRHQPVHAIDLVPTILELVGLQPTAGVKGNPPPLQGRSFAAALTDPGAAPTHESLWWCHEGHRGCRVGDWKIVAAKGEPWELYDLASDRCETVNHAPAHAERVAKLEREWNRIADECRSLAAADHPPAPSKPQATSTPAAANASPPNVVLVFADDMGYGDPGCYGGTAAATPAIDSLARDGIRFTDFHVAQAVCSASRAALLTGCYPNRIGIAGALGPDARHGLSAEETTIAELLQARGYRTAAVGKWHLGHHAPFLPTRHGFDEYLGLPYSNDMWPHHPSAKPGTYPPLPLFDGEVVVDAEVTPADQATLTARYEARAVDFIERAGGAADGRPFFLYLAHSMPHVPLFAGDAFRGKCPSGLYGDVLTEIDASVAAVLAALERTGHADDTLVIFTSDNGPWLSYGNHGGSAGPLREGKGTSFEGGIRVPCVARLPGVIPAGSVCDAQAMTIDILPTIAALTGQPLPLDDEGHCLVEGRRIDGRDVGQLFRGACEQAAEPVYVFWYAKNELQGVRQGKWKLFFPHQARSIQGQKPGRDGIPGSYRSLAVGRELYDLSQDPGESRDVAGAHPEIVRHLESLAEKARADLGDSLTQRPASNARRAGRLGQEAALAPAPVRPTSFRRSDAPPQPLAGRRPNMIYVMTDDQGYGDIAAHGNGILKTPHLDRLREESVCFTEFHVSPTCAPTRAALLTGRHEFRSGVTHTILERERLALDAVTLPELLRQHAGYTTGIFGKWHLGDEDAYQPGRRGFDRVFIHGAGGIGQSYPGSCGDVPGNTYFDPVIRSDGEFVRTKGYCTDVFFSAAIDWIDHCRKAKTPFFCYVSTNAPHGPLDCPPGSDAKYLEPLKAAGIKDTKKRADIAKFYGMIENIDTNVGRLLAQLDDWGLAEETLVVFTTDNGTATGAEVCNDRMRGRKGSPYRGGTRVPAFWRWEGSLPAGVEVPAVTAHIDVLPTLAEIAGVNMPAAVAAKIEGRSLVPLLEHAEAEWPDRMLVTHVGRWERGQAAASIRSNCRVRSGNWQLVNVKNRPKTWELYDLANDPGEEHDVAAQHPAVVARLAADYETWWQSVQGDLVNENLDGPATNPFKQAFWTQFGPDATAAP